ncbi:MAG: hypothetical protein ACI9XJ_000656 [Marivirga sp.]|jgi:hypothetical protein
MILIFHNYVLVVSSVQATEKKNYLKVCYLLSLGHELAPKIVYKGQKLTMLVIKNTTDKTIKTIPKTPEIMFIKNNVITTAAITILINLSTLPMFFFIAPFLCYTQDTQFTYDCL